MITQLITIGASTVSIVTALVTMTWLGGKRLQEIKDKLDNLREKTYDNEQVLDELRTNGELQEMRKRLSLLDLKTRILAQCSDIDLEEKFSVSDLEKQMGDSDG